MSPIQITPELARLVAHICADGYLYKYTQKRSKQEIKRHSRKKTWRNKWQTVYVNTTQALVSQFASDAKLALERKPVARDNEHVISGKWVYQLVQELGGGTSRDWSVAKPVLQGEEQIKTSWLRAFFDDEAYVDTQEDRITVTSVNETGIHQIQELLKTLGVRTSICGPYKYSGSQIFHLRTYSQQVLHFKNSVGFTHPEKKEKIVNLLDAKNWG